ncbi:MAG: DUF3823 domain-containing protein [Tannerella sp.]|jgi:hypothetical protein|nr:DUF3823 domain-containing protein [Tannerella sp.]
MKRIKYTLWTILCLTTAVSCALDNYDEPDARFYGKIIDATTGENFIMSSQGLQIRMWEISYKANPSPRNVNVKDDATFNNNKLFPGEYQALVTNGAFWPVRDTVVVRLESGKATEQNFTVTPYLKVSIADYHLDGTTLNISGKISAPIAEGLPRVLDIRPFVAITKYVGSANITAYSDPFRIDINKNIGEIPPEQVFSMSITGLLPGRTFYVRLGARVDDSFKANNFSEIIEIQVP